MLDRIKMPNPMWSSGWLCNEPLKWIRQIFKQIVIFNITFSKKDKSAWIKFLFNKLTYIFSINNQ